MPIARRPAKKKPAAKKKAAAKKKKKAPFVSKHPPKPRTREMLALIDKFRKVCLALPDTTEQEAWAEPTFRVGAGRMFAMCDSRRDGDPQLSVHVPAPLGAQESLVESDPSRFYRPPYVGSKGWVGVVLDSDTNWKMVASLVETAYSLIAMRSR
ncbi:MAG TPA: MmcQ/YjbR family DNA-binding protein [Polyangiales bacterium]|nr:MmcQ/YjbR family DNA-binding protein [Polyangiales bacterium]